MQATRLLPKKKADHPMHFIYLQQSGKPVEKGSGQFWAMAGVAVPEDRWRLLQLRVNGLQKSFQRNNYTPGVTRLNANDLLHPRNANRKWTNAYCKGLEKIVSTLELKFFLVVVDKRTTDKPAHPKWLYPLTYHYLFRPISQYLREQQSVGTLVIPPGREEERSAISELQFSSVFSSSPKHNPIVGSPLQQAEPEAVGLQVADFVATVGRRYHEHTFPKLYSKEPLDDYDTAINSHYQGFVKPNTYQSPTSDAKGYRIRGYIYLWRREGMLPGRQESGDQYATPRGDSDDGHPTGSMREGYGGREGSSGQGS